MDEKKKYRVTTPVAWGGRRERGEILELTDSEAIAIGLVEPVIEAPESAEAAAAPEAPVTPPTGDYAPVLSPDEQAAADAKNVPAETAPTETAPTEEVPAPENGETPNSVNA